LAGLLLMGAVLAGTTTRSQPGEPAAAKGSRPAANATEPQYNEQGDLKRPEGFESWVFVGANLGVEYRDDDAPPAPADKAPPKNPKVGNFHNVYINPEAFDVYAKTGKFPDKTILVLDVYKANAGDPKSIVSEGLFPGKQAGVAVAVKNRNRPDGSKIDWAYYDFDLDKKTAKAFPDKACYDCHIQHADDDNVWVQMYPTLRRIREQRLRRSK
jgi:hypothetical protein